MRVGTVRSGLIESIHHVSVVVATTSGKVLQTWGDPTVPFFYRSVIKPLQATISQEAGADLSSVQMALASSSHGGYPVHIAVVRSMLAGAGFGPDALGCPPGWPLATPARDLLVASGHTEPRRITHNCSGKHSAWLRACAARGWPTATYLNPDHPLQRRVIELVGDTTGVEPEPVGTDGCGAPTLRGDLTGLARAFARLSIDDRFTAARTATHRYPSLVADNLREDGRFGAWWSGPVKVGAAGLIAAGRHGIGIAAKSHEGSREVAVIGLLETTRRLGLMPVAAMDALADVARPPVYGGGRPVGVMKPLPS